jgi:hypothetical protein
MNKRSFYEWAAKPSPNFPAEAAKVVKLPAGLEKFEAIFAAKAAQIRLWAAPRKYNVDSDPNVPTEFKHKWRGLLQAKPGQKKKILAVWRLVADKNPETMIKPLKLGNYPVPDLCSVEANAICQYRKLAEEHYRLGLGPVTKGKLWNRVCALHMAYFKRRPTHRARVLKKIGLGSLPERPPGRPSGKWVP